MRSHQVFLRHVDLRKVFIINAILLFLFVSPFLPVSSYLHPFFRKIFYIIQWIYEFGIFPYLVFIAFFYHFAVPHKKYINTTLVVIFSCILTFYMIGFFVKTGVFQRLSRDYTIQKGVALVAALEKYELERGEYPRQLEQLVPEYMDRLPKSPSPIVKGFHYFRFDQKFYLQFEVLYDFEHKQSVEYAPKYRQDPDLHLLWETGFEGWKYADVYD